MFSSSAFVPYHRTDCIASCTKGHRLDHMNSMQSSILCFLLSMPAPLADFAIFLWSIHPFLLFCSCCFTDVKPFYRGITGLLRANAFLPNFAPMELTKPFPVCALRLSCPAHCCPHSAKRRAGADCRVRRAGADCRVRRAGADCKVRRALSC